MLSELHYVALLCTEQQQRARFASLLVSILLCDGSSGEKANVRIFCLFHSGPYLYYKNKATSRGLMEYETYSLGLTLS